MKNLQVHANKLESVKGSVRALANMVNRQYSPGPDSAVLLEARQRLIEFEQMLEIDYEAYVITASGRVVKLYQCTPDDIVTSDIVWSLCGQNRFLNHTSKPYSVGKHLIYGHFIAQERNFNPDFIKAWLLHDAEEAYVGDMPAPVKYAGSNLAHELASEHITRQLEKRYGIALLQYQYAIKQLDQLCRDHENAWRLGKGATQRLLEIVSLSDMSAHAVLADLYANYVEKL